MSWLKRKLVNTRAEVLPSSSMYAERKDSRDRARVATRRSQAQATATRMEASRRTAARQTILSRRSFDTELISCGSGGGGGAGVELQQVARPAERPLRQQPRKQAVLGALHVELQQGDAALRRQRPPHESGEVYRAHALGRRHAVDSMCVLQRPAASALAGGRVCAHPARHDAGSGARGHAGGDWPAGPVAGLEA